MFVLQNKKDETLFIKKFPFGSMIDEFETTHDINEAEKFYHGGSKLYVYRNVTKHQSEEYRWFIKGYKLVEVEIITQIKGKGRKEFEQIELFFGGD